MNPDVVQYIGFIVAALILTWGVIELNRRYFDRRKVDIGPLKTSWVNLDTHRADEAEESLPGDDAEEEEDDEKAESGIQTRAKQNGHQSESKNLL